MRVICEEEIEVENICLYWYYNSFRFEYFITYTSYHRAKSEGLNYAHTTCNNEQSSNDTFDW